MQNAQLVKATITNLVTGAEVACMFNPKEYTFSKTNKWEEVKQDEVTQPTVKFAGGSSGNLTLELLFDTYESHGKGAAGEDVRRHTKGLWEMMQVTQYTWGNPKPTPKFEPPRVKFKWGSFWSFVAVIVSINQTFTLFGPDGTPLRATVKVELKQMEEEGSYPGQNPTSGGNPGEHIHVVQEGETLAGIAYAEYGDATVWRHLAHTNPIADPRRLRAGQSLIIKPLPNI